MLIVKNTEEICSKAFTSSRIKKIVCHQLKTLGDDALNSAAFLKSVDLRYVEKFG